MTANIVDPAKRAVAGADLPTDPDVVAYSNGGWDWILVNNEPMYAVALESGKVPVATIAGRAPQGSNEIAPLTAFRDIDKLGLLKNVPYSISIHTCHTMS